MSPRQPALPRPHVVAHVAVGLDGATRGFAPDLAEFYGLAARWQEDVTLAGSGTILAQEEMLRTSPPGPGPDPDGPLLAVVDSNERVSAWEELRRAGHWRQVRALRGPHARQPVDLAAALTEMAGQGARTVRVDSGGQLIGALLKDRLLDEISLLVHPTLGQGPSWNNGILTDAAFHLVHHERRNEILVWLRYDIAYPESEVVSSRNAV